MAFFFPLASNNFHYGFQIFRYLGGMRDNEFTKILDWPGYRVFRSEIDETAKTLRLWVRRKRGNRTLICSRMWKEVSPTSHEDYQREVRELPWRNIGPQ